MELLGWMLSFATVADISVFRLRTGHTVYHRGKTHHLRQTSSLWTSWCSSPWMEPVVSVRVHCQNGTGGHTTLSYKQLLLSPSSVHLCACTLLAYDPGASSVDTVHCVLSVCRLRAQLSVTHWLCMWVCIKLRHETLCPRVIHLFASLKLYSFVDPHGISL